MLEGDSVWQKVKGMGSYWSGDGCSLNGKMRAGLTELPLSRLRGGERVGQAGIWGKSVLGRGNSKCKGTAAGIPGMFVEWQAAVCLGGMREGGMVSRRREWPDHTVLVGHCQGSGCYAK